MNKATNTDLWSQLSEVEQSYLAAIFWTDQSQEASHRQFPDGRKADEWRWMPCEDNSINELSRRLLYLNHTSEQRTKIFKALEKHGLIERGRQVNPPTGKMYNAIKITREGRALVRAATGAPKKALTTHQQWFVLDVVEAGLATKEETYRAFETRNDAQIKAWKPAVEALRAKRRQENHEELRHGRVVKTEQCAWCGGTVEVKVYPARHYAPDPVRRIHISYDGEDRWIEQYACSSECETKIREAKVQVVLERDGE